MRVTKTFTFIVSRNFGHPITWNVEAWRVYAGGLALATLLTAMTVLSVLYLFLHPRMTEMERTLQELQRERDALREAIHAADQRAFDAKQLAWIEAQGENGESGSAGEFPLTSTPEDDQYVPPLRLGDFRAQVDPRSVEVIFRIISQGDPERLRGGYLFAVFENQDAEPARYTASPYVEVNDLGFPLLYKGGIRFANIRTAQTYRRKIARQGPDEYFTHVTVYLFSLRGGLLAKERYPLERELFVAGT